MKFRVNAVSGYGHCGERSTYPADFNVEASSLDEAWKKAKEWEHERGTRYNPTSEQVENACNHCGCPDNGWAEWREVLEVLEINE